MRALFAALAVTALASQAGAQTPDPPTPQDDGWDRTELDGGGRMASVIFDNGFGVAVRCLTDDLEVLIAGLPEEATDSRRLLVKIGDEEAITGNWLVGTARTSALAPRPAWMARRLRGGGHLSVGIETDGAPARRYLAEIPASLAAVDEVLHACGWPAEDARDSLPSFPAGSAGWSRRPLPEFPPSALSAKALWGRVELNCLVRADGRPRQCRVESERPSEVGFAEAALEAAERARLDFPDDAPDTDHVIVFPISFRAVE